MFKFYNIKSLICTRYCKFTEDHGYTSFVITCSLHCLFYRLSWESSRSWSGSWWHRPGSGAEFQPGSREGTGERNSRISEKLSESRMFFKPPKMTFLARSGHRFMCYFKYSGGLEKITDFKVEFLK